MAAGSVDDTSWREDERHGVFEIPIEVPLRRRTFENPIIVSVSSPHIEKSMLTCLIHHMGIDQQGEHIPACVPDLNIFSLHTSWTTPINYGRYP